MTRVIADRYEITNSIGTGGMAEVFLATDRRLGRQVAVKVLDQSYAAQPAFVERFKREAQAAASIDHPNVVPVYDWGETDHSYFIAMGYVPGQTLSEVLTLRGPLPEADARTLIANVSSALQNAHDKGIVHRDIKPANILIDDSGEPRVTDFGIAQATGLSSLTETSVVLGSAHYMSPEQVSRGAIDARSDIYSLGIVAYEILAGRPPFRGDTIVEIAMQHMHEPPPPMRSIRPELTEETERIVLKCLEKDPGNRFSSADELRNAVESALQVSESGGATAPTVAVPVAQQPAGAAVEAGEIPERRPPRPRRSLPPTRHPERRTGLWVFGAAVATVAIIGLLALLISQLGDQEVPDGPDPQENDPGITEQEQDPESEAGPEEQPADEPIEEQPPDEPVEEQPPEETDGEQPEEVPGEEEAEPDQGTEPEDQQGEDPEDEQAEPQGAQAPEAAGNVSCDGEFQGGTADRVVVPGNASCSLNGVIVNNDIQMQQGSTLRAADTEVYGNIQAQGANELSLSGASFVDGNIEFERGGTVTVGGGHVTGNVQLEDNAGPLTIENLRIDGNLEVEGNVAGVTINSNTIAGDLECEENDPPPTGGGNSVGGDLEGQCSGL